MHASVVAIGATGVLIRGESGSGKSSLALGLIMADRKRRRLVADDRVILSVKDGALFARAPEPIAGLLEVRGQGLLPFPYLASVKIGLAVDIVPAGAAPRMPEPAESKAVLHGVTVPRLFLPIGIAVTHWRTGEHGWTFEPAPGVVADTVNGADYLYQVYVKADPRYSGRVTVPVLWDKARATIVNNESSEIIRVLNSAFDGVGAAAGDYYPAALRSEIDAVNERVYATLNNGVYRAGFARTQQAYEEAVVPLFETLDWLEARLGRQRYVAGDVMTEADWRLFTTLVRFDAVYVGHFKCNLCRLVDYPNLWDYTRALYQQPGIAATVNMMHIKRHYYESHARINPSGIVPLGPALDFDAPHTRG